MRRIKTIIHYQRDADSSTPITWAPELTRTIGDDFEIISEVQEDGFKKVLPYLA